MSEAASKTGELSKMIEVIAKALVDIPNEVSVAEVAGENTTVIELRVAKTDIGKIIGKEGKTAKAIRTILLGAATKLKRRTVLEIVE
ncbi:MAG: KH domain-containing protein [Bdellovibrionales bacterium]|nr:KH domain-containing protein [Bdellovibrionales bacterium]